jgi:GntR family transcriptional regulator, vanillate catabolism transcriptional regulator
MAKTAKRASLREQNKGELRSTGVLRAIRSAVLDGEVEPGSRINEVKLAAALGVSRTPVRSALQVLAGEGIVEYKDNRGFFARQFDLADILDAFEMRALAEGLSARLAAERGLSPEDEIAIEESLDRGEAALQHKDLSAARDVYSAANEAFHSTIQRASRSRLLVDVIALCNSVPQTLSQNVMSFSIDSVRVRMSQHRDIYQAILSRKPREAESLMVEHVLDVRRAIARDYARIGRT